ncbi:MAG: class I SAM-dependent methyltransferase [Phycisphaerales bacterium]
MERPPCELCGHPADPWLDIARDVNRPRVERSYRLWWCRPCAYGQVWPRLTEQECAEAYQIDGYYTHGLGPVSHAASGGKAGVLVRALRHAAWHLDRGVWALPIRDDRQLSVVDLGCGKADQLAELAARGHRVVGVEPDPQAVAVARSRGIEVHPGTAEHLPDGVARQRFDTALMMHSLEHCLRPLEALGSARGILHDGGVLIVEVPNNSAGGLTLAGAAWRWLDVPRHLNFFTPRSLRLALERAGFAVERTLFHSYARQFSAEWLADERSNRERLGVRSTLARSEAAWCTALLALTALATKQRKYDSLRIVARRTGTAEAPPASPSA